MLNRRSLLNQSAFLSLSPLVPGFLARTAAAAAPDRDGRILVVIQMDGGNDGLNTVIPIGDELYGKLRRDLRISRDRVCGLGESGGIAVGLHPAMKAAADMVSEGRLAIVQGVGYPNPDRSHFESMATWHTGRLGRDDSGDPGWLGRALDLAGQTDLGPSATHVGDESIPRALIARRATTASYADAADFNLALSVPPAASVAGADLASFVGRTVTSAYTTAAELGAAASRGGTAQPRYPETKLAQRLGLVARSIKAGLLRHPVRVRHPRRSVADAFPSPRRVRGRNPRVS